MKMPMKTMIIIITILINIITIIIIMEQVVRLYLGYLGNLGERVPELAGFWLLTILLQLPMQVIS